MSITMRQRRTEVLFPAVACAGLVFVAAMGCGSGPAATGSDGPGAGGDGAGGGGRMGGGGSGGAAGASSSMDGGTSPDARAFDGPGADAPGPIDSMADVAAMAPDATGLETDMATSSATDPAPGKYGTRASLLDPNSEMAIAALDGKIYVLGGYPASRVTQNTLQIYDVATNTWTRGQPAPIRVHHPVLAGVNGKLYSLGGQVDGQPENTARTFEYDPVGDAWRERRSMPTARGGGAGAVIGDRIYVVGGRPPAGNAFEVYDISDDAWESLPRLPTTVNQRNHLAAAAIDGKIYVAGGRYDGGGFGSPMTDALDMYDPATRTWTPRKRMLRRRGGVAGVAANGCFHVYGGEGTNTGEPNDVFPDHDVYDPIKDTWTALDRLPVPFHGVTGGAFVNGVVFMPGGGIRSGGTSGTRMHQVYRPNVSCGG